MEVRSEVTISFWHTVDDIKEATKKIKELEKDDYGICERRVDMTSSIMHPREKVRMVKMETNRKS